MKRIKNSITKQVQIEYETLNMLEQIATKQNITLGEAIRQTLRDAMRFQHRIPDCATPHIPARKREKRKPKARRLELVVQAEAEPKAYDPTGEEYPNSDNYQLPHQYSQYSKDCDAHAAFLLSRGSL